MQARISSGFQIPTFENQLLKFPLVDNPLKIPLHFENGVPTLSFGIGTPAQTVTAIFDTGSLVTWVASDKCNASACPGIDEKTKFHQKDSSTNSHLGYTIDINYFDGGFVRLEPELDTLTIMDSITIPNHLFGEAYEMRYPKGQATSANGRLGAGDFGAFMKYMPSAKDMMQYMEGAAKGYIARAVGDDRTSSGYGAPASPDFKKRDGVHAPFYFNIGSDPSMYKEGGKLYDVPLMPESEKVLSPFWKLPLHGIKLVPSNNKTETTVQKRAPLLRLTLTESSYGSIDSSTPYLHFPLQHSRALNDKLGAQFDSSLGVYTIPCEQKKKENLLLVFEFEGVDALIPAHQYIIKKGDQCHSAIVDTGNDEDQFHLGGPFFRSFYLEYHTSMRRMSMAESTAKLGLLRDPSPEGVYDLVDMVDTGVDVMSEL
ncbi:aspartic peptidase domain-containing protein [Chlamydoabsidia padenii]|nr:aspartic peptidase domain-containing protein [Chlamydoabsidia padenii]